MFDVREDRLPKSDRIFGQIFENRNLFIELYKSIIGAEIQLESDPMAQVTYTGDNSLMSDVRFDVLGVSPTGSIYSIDMQREYEKYNIENRTVYYACRAIARQKIGKSLGYMGLKSVTVSFIMSDYDITTTRTDRIKELNLTGINHIVLYNESSGKQFTDLINIYEIFVPTILRDAKRYNPKLEVFLEFFNVSTKEDAYKFKEKYSENDIAVQLMKAYDLAIGKHESVVGVDYIQGRYYQSYTDLINSGIQQGIQQGLEQGAVNERIKTVKQCRKLNLSENDICNIIGITLKELNDFCKNYNV